MRHPCLGWQLYNNISAMRRCWRLQCKAHNMVLTATPAMRRLQARSWRCCPRQARARAGASCRRWPPWRATGVRRPPPPVRAGCPAVLRAATAWSAGGTAHWSTALPCVLPTLAALGMLLHSRRGPRRCHKRVLRGPAARPRGALPQCTGMHRARLCDYHAFMKGPR